VLSRCARIGRSRISVAVGAVTIAVTLAACGSSSSSSPKDAAAGSSAVDVNKVYIPGVPSIADLLKSTETSVPEASPPVAKGKNVIFMSCGQAVAGCSATPNAMADAAKAVGWRYRIIDGQLNVNNGWVTGMRQAIAAKPDAIVITGPNCQDIKQPLIEAKAAGIAVLAINSSDCNDPLTPSGVSEPLFTLALQFSKDAPTAGDFARAWGKLQAAYVIDMTQGRAKVIETNDNVAFGLHQKEGWDEVLKLCSDCSVVKQLPYKAADTVAGGQLFQQFTTTLIQHPEANAAILNYDNVAIGSGLAKAVLDAHRSGSMAVSGGEGTGPGLDNIRGHLGIDGDVSFSSPWHGWAAVDELNRYFNHQPLVPEGIGFRLVDAEHNLPAASGQPYDSPYDYKSAYKKIWGINS
jgi:ribose transport system substrate-binding protein